MSSKRGTSSLSLESGEERAWGSGWVWDGEWLVRLQCSADCPSIPTCVQACGDVWQVRYEGSPTVCFRCWDTQHLATTCKAAKREERVTSRWDPVMGSSVEVFFPTKRLAEMSEESFINQQRINIQKGNKVGVRFSPCETGKNIEDVSEEESVKVEEKVKDLDLKIKEMEMKFNTERED